MVSEQSVVLERELGWLATLVDTSLSLYFDRECRYSDVRDLVPPDISNSSSAYGQIVREYSMSFDERAILILALAPYIRPQLLDSFLIKHTALDRGFTEFGGTIAGAHGGFWPTLETAAFVLAGSNLERRLTLQRSFDPNHFFRQRKVLLLDESQQGKSVFSAGLYLTPEYLSLLTTGSRFRPQFSSSFPAQRISTQLDGKIWCFPSTRWKKLKRSGHGSNIGRP